MCGRFQVTLTEGELRRLFGVVHALEPFPPRYNVAPTQPVHVVRAGPHGRACLLMRWGLLPAWAKDPNDVPLLINARAETAADKPAFRNAIRRRRVVVPATGFYEWARIGKTKVPFLLTAEGPIALAGLAETWCGPNGEEMDTVAILTGEARGRVAELHGRMPLTIPLERLTDWLDPANEDGHAALAWTERLDYALRPVSKRLSNARNEGEGLMTPDGEGPTAVAEPDQQLRLL